MNSVRNHTSKGIHSAGGAGSSLDFLSFSCAYADQLTAIRRSAMLTSGSLRIAVGMSRTILRARAPRSAAYGVVLVAMLTGTPMGNAAEQGAEPAPSMVEWLAPPLPTNKP